jgi:hypothetical protein
VQPPQPEAKPYIVFFSIRSFLLSQKGPTPFSDILATITPGINQSPEFELNSYDIPVPDLDWSSFLRLSLNFLLHPSKNPMQKEPLKGKGSSSQNRHNSEILAPFVIFEEPDKWKWSPLADPNADLETLEAIFYFIVSRSSPPLFNDCMT